MAKQQPAEIVLKRFLQRAIAQCQSEKLRNWLQKLRAGDGSQAKRTESGKTDASA